MPSTTHHQAAKGRPAAGKHGKPAEPASPVLQTAVAPVVDEVAITKFLLLSGKALRAIEDGKIKGDSAFFDRQHLLGAVAALAVASEMGDLAKASAKTGILPNALDRWVEQLESRFPLRGLRRTLHSAAAIRELGLPSDRELPVDLSFGVWSSANVTFRPAVNPPAEKSSGPKEAPASQPRPLAARQTAQQPRPAPAAAKKADVPTAPPQEPKPKSPAAQTRVATPDASVIPGSPAVEWIRGVVANAYREMERYSALQQSVQSGSIPKDAAAPSYVALKGAIFWQAFAQAKGDHAKLLEILPGEAGFVSDQLEVFGRQKGVALDRAFFKSAFQVPGSPACRVHTSLPPAVDFDAIEAQLRVVQAAVTGAK